MALRASLLIAAAVLALPAFAADTSSPAPGPDLTAVRAKIASANYSGAVTDLRPLVASNPQDPDVHNLLGFSLRKAGNREEAWMHYRKALEIDPNHKGALEYQGELFVETNQPEKAKENLARLRTLCPGGCTELADLEKAIAAKPAGTN